MLFGKEVFFVRFVFSSLAFALCWFASSAPACANEASTFLSVSADVISMPLVAILILAIGFAGAFKEVAAPGSAVGGLVAFCFLGFFFSVKYMTGQIDVLAVGLIALGIALLVVEAFLIPGVGVVGFLGFACFCFGIVKCGKTFEEGVLILMGVIVTTALFIWLLFKYVMSSEFFIEKFCIKVKPASPDEIVEAPEEFVPDVGMKGVAVTAYKPCGKAVIAGHEVDSVTAGEFLEKGVEVEVTEVSGNRVVVREIKN